MSYGPEWIFGGGVTLVALVCIPWIGPVIVLAAVVLAVMGALVALVGALAAAPYFVLRSTRRRIAGRPSRSSELESRRPRVVVGARREGVGS